jgi:hypothetical protein
MRTGASQCLAIRHSRFLLRFSCRFDEAASDLHPQFSYGRISLGAGAKRPEVISLPAISVGRGVS